MDTRRRVFSRKINHSSRHVKCSESQKASGFKTAFLPVRVIVVCGLQLERRRVVVCDILILRRNNRNIVWILFHATEQRYKVSPHLVNVRSTVGGLYRDQSDDTRPNLNKSTRTHYIRLRHDERITGNLSRKLFGSEPQAARPPPTRHPILDVVIALLPSTRAARRKTIPLALVR